MKKIPISILLLISSFSFLLSQVSPDSITIVKEMGGYQYYRNNQRLTVAELAEVMKDSQEAFQEIQKAQTTNSLATIIGGAGGICIGIPIGMTLAGVEADWILAGVGAGLILISIPIYKLANKQAISAVNTYNEEFRNGFFDTGVDLSFIVSGNGIGIRMRF